MKKRNIFKLTNNIALIVFSLVPAFILLVGVYCLIIGFFNSWDNIKVYLILLGSGFIPLLLYLFLWQDIYKTWGNVFNKHQDNTKRTLSKRDIVLMILFLLAILLYDYLKNK